MPRQAKRAKRANRPNPRAERRPRHLSNQENESSETSSKGRARKVEIIPRNLSQETYVNTLNDDDISIVFAMGPAGTGKTMLATQWAIQQLQSGDIEKIIITRPAVSVDEQHGFLPGTLTEKLAPWVVPIVDVIKEHYSVKAVEKMLEEEVLSISPLAYMRGRTFKNAVVIADEMQNATPSQMKMLLTRIGDNTRMVVTGDLRQHDRGFSDNGLKDFVERLKLIGSRRIAVCEFSPLDVERHPVIEEILRLYGDE